MVRLNFILATLVCLGLSSGPATAQAPQGFPSRPITLINVFAAGGPSDIHLRVIAGKAKDIFGVPVVVENKMGGAGTVGPAVMAQTAKPDGYTISYVGAGIYTVPGAIQHCAEQYRRLYPWTDRLGSP